MASEVVVQEVLTTQQSKEARKAGATYFPFYELSKFLDELDVVVLAVPMTDFESLVKSLPSHKLRGKLVVDVCPLNEHPKVVMLENLPADVDILCTHPMITPHGSDEDPYDGTSWHGRPVVYDKVRISDAKRCHAFLNIFEQARCQMVEMAAELHDTSTADAQFVTHLIGHLLNKDLLPPTPVISREYGALQDVADMTSEDTFDFFFGMFRYHPRAREFLDRLRDNLAHVEQQLAAKDAVLTARAEIRANDRRQLIEETKQLLQEIAAEKGDHSGEIRKKLFDASSSKKGIQE